MALFKAGCLEYFEEFCRLRVTWGHVRCLPARAFMKCLFIQWQVALGWKASNCVRLGCYFPTLTLQRQEGKEMSRRIWLVKRDPKKWIIISMMFLTVVECHALGFFRDTWTDLFNLGVFHSRRNKQFIGVKKPIRYGNLERNQYTVGITLDIRIKKYGTGCTEAGPPKRTDTATKRAAAAGPG